MCVVCVCVCIQVIITQWERDLGGLRDHTEVERQIHHTDRIYERGKC